MTKENKKLLKETTEILKQLDRNSLELIRTGAVLLRTRDAMESQDQNGLQRETHSQNPRIRSQKLKHVIVCQCQL